MHANEIGTLIVDGKVIVELRSVEKVHPAHKRQVLTYPRPTEMKLGQLLNFGEVLMRDGVTRIRLAARP
jgi:GxxExxY protein